jgi:hypothetical protein
LEAFQQCILFQNNKKSDGSSKENHRPTGRPAIISGGEENFGIVIAPIKRGNTAGLATFQSLIAETDTKY